MKKVLKNIWNGISEAWYWLKGKKTYILAGVAVVIALGGFIEGHMTLKELIEAALVAGGFSTVRSAVPKK